MPKRSGGDPQPLGDLLHSLVSKRGWDDRMRFGRLRDEWAAVVGPEVAARSTNSFDVCVVPHWDVSSSVIETFNSACSALERHAEISLQLRETGWVVSRNSDSATSELAA